MYTVGICGHIGEDKNLLNGQTIKTKVLIEEIENILGSKNVKTLDSHGWRKRIFKILGESISLIKNSENIIILPAHNGVKVFVPLFVILNIFYKRKIHYIVIGGWLPEFVQKNKWLSVFLRRLSGIYTETQSMKHALEGLQIYNGKYLPNFKRLSILKEDELIWEHTEPYKLCTFSRVTEEKGISIAIQMVEAVNRELGRQAYALDIYGPIDKEYEEKFESLLQSTTDAISYKGIVDFDQTVHTLKPYFALLFPTYYHGEGFAGTLIDAFSAGVPAICSSWKYNTEIICDKEDGFIYDYKKNIELKEILIAITKEPNMVIDMKTNCLKRAEEYLPNKVIKDFINYM